MEVLCTVSGTVLYKIVLEVSRTTQTYSESNKIQSQNKHRVDGWVKDRFMLPKQPLVK